MNDIWTIKAALDWTQGYLERKGDNNPRVSAQWLLAEATGLRRIDLYTQFNQPLSLEERATLRDYVARRAAGEPLQYITGEVGFRHIAVKVRPGVLIPRPETEVLVSEALSLLPSAPRPRAAQEESEEALSETQDGAMAEGLGKDYKNVVVEIPEYLVADLCTGSGCIACSIAYEHPLTRIIATDIAPEAVLLASDNATALQLGERIEVLACDLGLGIDVKTYGKLDLVVSNPPYIPTAVLDEIPREVADFEPSLALDGGLDGLDIFRRLLDFSKEALKEGGGFAFELHETCLDEAARLATDEGFVEVKVVRDLADRPRVLTGRKAMGV